MDLIRVTHGHGDHAGDTAAIAEITGAKVAMNTDMGHTAGTLEIVSYDQLNPFKKSGPIKPPDGITVTVMRAEHSSEILHTDPDKNQKRIFLGGEP